MNGEWVLASKCPHCGGRMTVSAFYSYSLDYVIRRDAASAKAEAVTEALKSVEVQPEETVTPTEAVDDSEVVALARLADSVGRGRSDDVKRIIMWVAINRSEDRSHGYGLTLLGEIARPKQWQEYTPDATYLEPTLKLAQEVYETWQTGGPRPIYSDMPTTCWQSASGTSPPRGGRACASCLRRDGKGNSWLILNFWRTRALPWRIHRTAGSR